MLIYNTEIIQKNPFLPKNVANGGFPKKILFPTTDVKKFFLSPKKYLQALEKEAEKLLTEAQDILNFKLKKRQTSRQGSSKTHFYLQRLIRYFYKPYIPLLGTVFFRTGLINISQIL